MTLSPAQIRSKGLPYWKQILASGFYTGLSPIASGTVGSALALMVWFLPHGMNFFVLLGLSLVAFIGGIPIASDCERVLGSDPSFVTLDEFAGMWLTMASPAAALGMIAPRGLSWLIICFLVFRVFDIAKPWPASYFDRQPGGLGIMADDMVAGLYANLVSHLIWFGLSWIGPVLGYTVL